MKFECPNCHVRIQVVATEKTSKSLNCPDCGSQLSASEETETVTTHQAETRLGRFTLKEQLGTGQFGVVWKAFDNEMRRPVALKLPHAYQVEAGNRDLYRREAQAASQIRHDNCVRVYDIAEVDDQLFIVSDFIDGVTLKEYAETRKLSPQAIAELLGTIARAVHAAHESGVIHRDLKPRNILIDGEGKPYVTDFGLAKTDVADFMLASNGQVLGTPAYMPPEQAAGKSHEADRRSDVYALGVILYELLAGRRPFEGQSNTLRFQILHDRPTPLRQLKAQLPRDLEVICLQALEKEPDDRFKTALEFAEDLERFVRGEPIQARPPSLWRQTKYFTQRHAAMVTIATLALICCSLLAAFLVSRWFPAEDVVRGTTPSGNAMPLPPVPAGAREVIVETQPSADEIYFVPLGSTNNYPLWDDLVRGGEYNGKTILGPGKYLVFAFAKDEAGQRYSHAVLRFVPPKGKPLHASPYHHQNWTLQGSQVAMHPIELFKEADFLPGGRYEMIQVEGGRLSSPMLIVSGQPVIDIPDLHVDTQEFPVGRFPRWLSWKLLHQPLTNISWEHAVHLAEVYGVRLPYDYEFEYLLKQANSNVGFSGPFGPERWQKQTVGQVPWDSSQWGTMHAPLLNLFGGVAEWTLGATNLQSTGTDKEIDFAMGSLAILEQADQRIAEQQLQAKDPNAVRSDWLHKRLALEPPEKGPARSPRIGFRGVRDVDLLPWLRQFKREQQERLSENSAGEE